MINILAVFYTFENIIIITIAFFFRRCIIKIYKLVRIALFSPATSDKYNSCFLTNPNSNLALIVHLNTLVC